jgi:hypothetical protein
MYSEDAVNRLILGMHHDWMNQLQVLQGYMQSDKTLKVQEYLAGIVKHSRNLQAVIQDGFGPILIASYDRNHSSNTISTEFENRSQEAIQMKVHVEPMICWFQEFQRTLLNHDKNESYIHVSIKFSYDKEEIIIMIRFEGNLLSYKHLVPQVSHMVLIEESNNYCESQWKWSLL